MNITTFMQEMVKANVPFIFQSHLDGANANKLTDKEKEKGLQMMFLKFQWKYYDSDAMCNRTIPNVKKLVDETLNGSICKNVSLGTGSGGLYTAFGKPWSYSLYTMVVLPNDDKVVKEFMCILTEIERITKEEPFEEQNINIDKYVKSLPEFWKEEGELKFSYWV